MFRKLQRRISSSVRNALSEDLQDRYMERSIATVEANPADISEFSQQWTIPYDTAFVEAIRDHAYEPNHDLLADLNVFELHNVFLQMSTGMVVLGDGRLLQELVLKAKTLRRGFMADVYVPHDVVELKGTYASLHTNFGRNYTHWFTEFCLGCICSISCCRACQ